MPRRLSLAGVTVAALFASLTAFPFLFPNQSAAEPASINSGIPASAPDDDEDIDANLVPLEPELTITPPDLSSTEEAADKNAGNVAGHPPAAGTPASITHTSQPILASSSNEISYNIPVIVDPTVENHIRFFNT